MSIAVIGSKPWVYILGPMRNRPYYNFPSFDRARDLGLSKGFSVISPADIDREMGIDLTTPEAEMGVYPDDGGHAGSLDEIQRRDVEAILALRPGLDGVVVLEGWELSTGAPAELFLAKWRGLVLFDQRYKALDPKGFFCGYNAERN